MSLTVESGRSFPLGATWTGQGVNFCVYSKSARYVDLLLFNDVDDSDATHAIRMERGTSNHTFHYWHCFVSEVRPGQLYAYRVTGPDEPNGQHAFDANRVLLDPYGKCVDVPKGYDRDEIAHGESTDASIAMKSVVVDLDAFDWEGDVPINRPLSRSVIYEMHVRGFTRNENSGVPEDRRGTFLGLIDKIPYLQKLGVTAVELLPVFQFDPQEAENGNTNYWGYNPISFFAPHQGYASDQSDPQAAIDEFREMVKALHQANIQVFLDVVYNHTAEGNEFGPTMCFKGFENSTYYLLDQDTHQYSNFSGTGNTLNANHSVVRRMIMDSLHHWVEQMHVDGFRFDLASILSRDAEGHPLPRPPILWDIESDPFLSGTRIIAEAWDAAGLYQVGSFFGDRWKEWNGQFRDDVRSFLKGDAGYASKVASRFLASPDIYGHKAREPEQSVNFVTCHDGFTLNDLVSYNEKHNEANGEGNRDGTNDNRSWNCGVEGPTNDEAIGALRKRQIKNALAFNLFALGTPMILMGDEVRRTQQGNNNAYCQDNELSWFDWSLVDENSDLLAFVRKLIRFRLSIPAREDENISLNELLHQTKIDWHGVRLHQPDWSAESRSVAFSLHGRKRVFHMIYNAYWKPLEFELPPRQNDGPAVWRKIVDTSEASPDDFCTYDQACIVEGASYRVGDRTLVLLVTEGEIVH